MNSKKHVLMISKPVSPPWNDSAKNIVRDQVRNGSRFNYTILTTKGAPKIAQGVSQDPLYSGEGKFSAGIRQNFKVMFRGFRPRGAVIYHYFFAPNTLTSLAGRVQRTIARVKTVQTICSAPTSFEGIERLLFTDRVIALSKDTQIRLTEHGIDPSRIALIPPGIEPIPKPEPSKKKAVRNSLRLGEGPLIVFPGDFEFSSAAETVAAAADEMLEDTPDATLVFACRIKRDPSKVKQEEIRARLHHLGDSVRFINELEDMPSFIGAADAVLMPAESLYAKMDVPLVILEAMSQGVPLVLAKTPPLGELLDTGAALEVSPGNPKELANSVKKILSNSQLARQLGLAGENAIRERFSASAMASRTEDLYELLLNE